jgi:hypothetical protein
MRTWRIQCPRRSWPSSIVRHVSTACLPLYLICLTVERIQRRTHPRTAQIVSFRAENSRDPEHRSRRENAAKMDVRTYISDNVLRVSLPPWSRDVELTYRLTALWSFGQQYGGFHSDPR